eukprot:tig00021795_g23526.t1
MAAIAGCPYAFSSWDQGLFEFFTGRGSRAKKGPARPCVRAGVVRRKRARSTTSQPYPPSALCASPAGYRCGEGAGGRGARAALPELPDELLAEIVGRLALRDLAALAATCRPLRAAAAAALPLVRVLDLSAWAPGHEKLAGLLGRAAGAREVRVDCWNVYRDAWLARLPRPLERLELRNANFLSPAGCALVAAAATPLRALVVTTSYRHDLGEAQYQDLGLGVVLRAAASTLEELCLDVPDERGALRWDLAPLRLPRLRRLALRSAAPVDLLQRLPATLRSLSVSAAASPLCVLGDGYVEAVCAACPQLEELELGGMAWAGRGAPAGGLAGLAALVGPPPLALVSDRSFAALARLRSLRVLRLELVEGGWPSSASDAGVALLAASSRSLVRLGLCGMRGVGDAALLALAASCGASLEELDLSRTAASDAGLAALARACPRLARLALSQCERLESLELFGCGGVGDAALCALATHCTRLRLLDARGCAATDLGVAMLLASPAAGTLEVLRLGKAYSRQAQAKAVFPPPARWPPGPREEGPRPFPPALPSVVVVPGGTYPPGLPLTDASLALMAAPGRCARLRELVLVDAAVTDWFLERAARSLGALQILQLVKCERVTGAALRLLAAGATRGSLREVHLRDSGARVGRREVEALRGMRALRQALLPCRETTAIPALHASNRLLDVCFYSLPPPLPLLPPLPRAPSAWRRPAAGPSSPLPPRPFSA